MDIDHDKIDEAVLAQELGRYRGGPTQIRGLPGGHESRRSFGHSPEFGAENSN
jgi:hypothetical protein